MQVNWLFFSSSDTHTVNCSFCDSFCTPQCDSMILPSAACIERAVDPLLVRPIRRFLMRFSCRRFLICICSSASASNSSSPFLPPRTPTFLPASYGLVYLPYVFKGLLGCAGIGHSRSCSPMAPARNWARCRRRNWLGRCPSSWLASARWMRFLSPRTALSLRH